MRHFAARVEGLAAGDTQHGPLLEHIAQHSGMPREDFIGVRVDSQANPTWTAHGRMKC